MWDDEATLFNEHIDGMGLFCFIAAKVLYGCGGFLRFRATYRQADLL